MKIGICADHGGYALKEIIHPFLIKMGYPVDMQFNYDKSYTSGTPEAYETLLLDIIEGDSTLFMRADQVEAAWNSLMPIINSWDANPSVNFPNYKAGMQGPEDAEALIAKGGQNALPFTSKIKPN